MEYHGEDTSDEMFKAEMRMKNLMWTVSGNYTLDTQLDYSLFRVSKHLALYDAIRQGALDRWFDKDAFGMYILKKVYYGADVKALTQLAQLVVDSGSWLKVIRERPGTLRIRRMALEDILDEHFDRLNETVPGRLCIAMCRGYLTGKWEADENTRKALDLIRSCENSYSTFTLIWTLDRLYNTVFDRSFLRKHGDLWYVLSTSLEEIREFGWRDLLNEEVSMDLTRQYLEKEQESSSHLSLGEESPNVQKAEPYFEERGGRKRVIVVDSNAAAKMYSYIERTYGRSYLTDEEQGRRCRALCKGAHRGCLLYYTEGILHGSVMVNAQLVTARKMAEDNMRLFKGMRNMIRRNIEVLAMVLKQSILLRSQTERVYSNYGRLVPNRLWRVGRTTPGRIFCQTTKEVSNEIAVNIIMDGSGSQHNRQSAVAIQAYIISAALSIAGIPHRLSSFRTFWDYTVLTRYRGYDDPPESDLRALEFISSANNRDGLAIRAAGWSLKQRPEDNRILIILSDARPNDIIVDRPGSRLKKPYYGKYALRDTALEVRKIRDECISVLGVYTGTEKDLEAEQTIFGSDFVYIRDIRNFSKVVGKYMVQLLSQDTGQT